VPSTCRGEFAHRVRGGGPSAPGVRDRLGNSPVALARCLLCSNSMGHITNHSPTQHVYRGRGLHTVRTPPCDTPDPAEIKVPTIADSVPATWIMSQEVICAREDLDLEALTDLILRRHIGCVPVINADGHPIGMITKFDLVEQLIAADDPEAAPVLTAGQLMMPIALTLDEHATIAHVAAMMAVEDIHHIPIVTVDGCLIGVISSMDIVRWLAANDGFLLQDASMGGSP
jgi:CBS domain-containing protein